METGYLHPNYARSLMEFGNPFRLPCCEGWLLERRIPGTPYSDGMGPYPLFFCKNWEGLGRDIISPGKKLVSLSLVTDPFAGVNPAHLREFFDKVIPFKEHFVADLKLPLEEIAGKKRRKNARNALRRIDVDICLNPVNHLEEWVDLYNGLIKRHQIGGIKAFSRRAFTVQLSLPGTVLLRAIYEKKTIAAQLYFYQEEVVHCHLGAANPLGYELGAIAALDLFSLEYFADKVRYLNLGGGIGLVGNGEDGLSRYKKAWSNEIRLSFFCGKIYDREVYDELSAAGGDRQSDYFPLYRKGEFG